MPALELQSELEHETNNDSYSMKQPLRLSCQFTSLAHSYFSTFIIRYVPQISVSVSVSVSVFICIAHI